MKKILNSKFNIQSSKRGQSLIEILVAVSLAAVFLGGAVILITTFLASNKRSREIQTAIDLGSELSESARTLANQNWYNFYQLNKGMTNHYNVTTTPSVAIIVGDATTTINGIDYTRWFYVENVYRSGSNDIVAATTPGSAEDPGTQFIVVRVTWTKNPNGLNFSEYLTRSRNEIFRQNDWSGGPGQEIFPGENANHKFATSTSIDYSSSSGSLYLISTALASGTLISSVFDARGSTSLNSILWQGLLGSGSVLFQIASSSSALGPWNYFGHDANPNGFYDTSAGPNIAVPITWKDFNNTRYFRYKIFLNVSGEIGVVTGDLTSLGANDIAIDSTFLYGVGDGGGLRIEKRLLTTGALDPGFGTGGVINAASPSRSARGIAINSTYMYVAGYDNNSDWRIEKRLLTTGALDAGFGTGGVVTGAGLNGLASDIAIDPTYMYVFGKSNNDWRIEKRLLTTGALDAGFGAGGVVTGAASSQESYSIAISGTYMYVAGGDANLDWRIEKRLLTTGALDAGFGTGGIVTGAALSKDVYSIAISGTYMYIAGWDDNFDWRIEKRLLTTGALDPGFGTGGIITDTLGLQPWDVAVDSSYMYIAGEDDNHDWRIEKRLLTTGALDAGFGTGGIITGSALSRDAFALVIDAIYMYVAGYDNNSDWRIEKRLLTTGTPDAGFGSGPVSPRVDSVIINYSP